MNHAALLSLFVEEALDFLRSNDSKPEGVAVSGGPGSYTGLRIGVSTAKGLCYGSDIPLIALDTLKIMFAAAVKQTDDSDNSLFCPMIDARRMEVYCEIFDHKGNTVREVSAEIINEASFRDILQDRVVYFFGNGSDKCREIIHHPNARLIDDITPLAENMISLAKEAFNKKEFSDVAYYEPFYLKEFQATTPKNSLK